MSHTDGGDSPSVCGHGLEVDEPPLGGEEKAKCLCQDLSEQKFLAKLEEFARVQFHWDTFWKELAYAVFYPLSLPLIALWEGGSYGIINRQYWGGSILVVSQFVISVAFLLLNCLSPLYFSPDIVVVDILWICRGLVLATKYGFISDAEMRVMREEVLPQEVHRERTLMFSWSNPIPLRVLKRELLLAAVRQNALRCNSALRLNSGASDKTVHDIMKQLSESPKDSDSQSPLSTLRSWDSLSRAIGFDKRIPVCRSCKKMSRSNKSFEGRWVDICMNDIYADAGLVVPKEDFFEESEEATETDQKIEKVCPALDLPALLLAAYVVQRAGDLLRKKKFLHQVFVSPWRIYWSSVVVGLIHAIIPFATRAISGQPSTFGGHHWYHYVISASSFLISYNCMAASVTFMLGALADFRRRFFVAKILNTLLKDGNCRNDTDLIYKQRQFHNQHDYLSKSVYHLGLAIDFSDPRSILGWWSVRVLVQDFGLGFYRRVNYYATYFAMYCGVLIAYLVVKLFANKYSSFTYIVAVVVYDLLVFLSLLYMVVLPGGETNELHHEHGATLSRIKMAISTKLDRLEDALEPKERQTLQQSLDVLRSISEAIYWNNLTSKVTFLGFTAGAEILGVMIGVGGAVLGIGAQQLTSTL